MSFHEKSAWACLVSIALVFVPYFWFVFQQPMAFFGLLVLAVIVQVALLVAFLTVNALVTRSIRKSGDVPPHDELDRLIELRAAKLSGFVLAFAVMSWCLVAMVAAPAIGAGKLAPTGGPDTAPSLSQLQIPVTLALTAIQLLFAGFVIANIAYYGSIIVGYRRLAGE